MENLEFWQAPILNEVSPVQAQTCGSRVGCTDDASANDGITAPLHRKIRRSIAAPQWGGWVQFTVILDQLQAQKACDWVIGRIPVWDGAFSSIFVVRRELCPSRNR